MYEIIEKKAQWRAACLQSGLQSIFIAQPFAQIFLSAPQLFVYRDQKRMAILVFMREGKSLCGLHYGGVLTTCGDKVFHAAVRKTFLHFCQVNGIVDFQMRKHPFLPTVSIGVALKKEPFVFMDLRPSQKDIWGAISQRHRRCIQRAEERGLTVSYTSGTKVQRTFYDLYRQTMERKGVPSKDSSFFEQFFKLSRKNYTIAVVQRANRIVASSLLLLDAQSVFFTHGGITAEAYDDYAKHLMIFDAALYFKERGFNRLVLGTGSKGYDSVFRFKRGFTNGDSWIDIQGNVSQFQEPA